MAPELDWLFAVAAAVAYFVISLVIGDRFPFSRYSMYARERGRRVGAVPVFLAAGEPVSIDSFGAFRMNGRAMVSRGFPCSLEWQVQEMRRWVERHPAPPDGGDGPVRVQFGFRMLTVDDAGRISETLKILVEGTAWPST